MTEKLSDEIRPHEFQHGQLILTTKTLRRWANKTAAYEDLLSSGASVIRQGAHLSEEWVKEVDRVLASQEEA